MLITGKISYSLASNNMQFINSREEFNLDEQLEYIG